jgi:3-methyladenine DNA glycosylase AlkD
MNKYHLEILAEIKKAPKHPAGNFKKKNFDLNKYLGSPHKLYFLNSPSMQNIAKEWSKNHSDVSSSDLFDFLTALFKGESTEEKMVAAFILEYLFKLHQDLDLSLVDKWLNHLAGWAEIDTLGTGPFGAKDVLNSFPEWKKWAEKWSKDQNINKRRFSLVVLIIPIRDSAELKLSDLAFSNIDRLKSEKEVLITKAISWLLRSLIKNHRAKVVEYVKKNESMLPKIAVRETSKKLLLGKK